MKDTVLHHSIFLVNIRWKGLLFTYLFHNYGIINRKAHICLMHTRHILYRPKEKQKDSYLNLQLYNIVLFPSISQLLLHSSLTFKVSKREGKYAAYVMTSVRFECTSSSAMQRSDRRSALILGLLKPIQNHFLHGIRQHLFPALLFSSPTEDSVHQE